MARINELRLMTKVARLYYEQSEKQADIAEQLRISQATVSRLLRRAQNEGIVRISVHVSPGLHPELEEAIEQRYGLENAVIADCERDDETALLRAIGGAAAFFLETTLAKDEIIGISSWSETLLAVVDAMHPLTRTTGAHVVQILGGMGDPVAETHASRLVSRLASLVGGTATFLSAPGVVGSAESLRVLKEDVFLRSALEMFDKVTLALVGIGAVEPSKLLARSGNVFAQAELELLKAQGSVGDLLLHFFDAEGKPVVTDLDERVVAMTLHQLQRVPRVVGIAGGSRKLSAIRGALDGGWINALVTDRFTAQQLVN